ncbi:MAG: putative 4-mercaptohistidine N1-methyltransferase [Verrucomicrobiae bacterium]|nr:putative 4-mercaptohistidine N1-methyltransferase [Verrucomicrobiae bacterium]MCP5539270.1 putative 4-mercaptohistidine N1-methyltransferase [Akkermansiaceae bacterium]
MNPYEQDRLLDTYLLFHYGSRGEILAGSALEAAGAAFADEFFRFPVATVAEMFDPAGAPFERALDIGCAVGRSAFELSKQTREVIGIDFSRAFIGAAQRLARGEILRYRRCSEAHLGDDELAASAPADSQPDRVAFETGDAMDLRPDLGVFDLVHAANLLCRLPEPRRFLNRLPALVKPGGQLVFATPATWLDEFTPPENQPGGLTLDFLRETLDASFALRRVTELPFLIREHARKFQVSTSQASVWVRR